MAFPPEFLDEIRARVPLAGVVGRRVKLAKRGREHSGLCPFHNEKTPSFTVSEDKGFYHCFGCGAHGDALGFVMRMEGLSFPEAVERLAGEAGLRVPQASPEERAAARRRADLYDVVEAAAAWFEERLAGSEGAEARAYLESRGLRRETVTSFRLGYAPDRRGMLRAALNARGLDNAQLAEAGLIKLPEAPQDAPDAASAGAPRDYFLNRIIFPITDRRGRAIAFGGRALGESRAKYLNSPETPLFHKGRVLYNQARARQAAHDTGELIVCEGYMDVIALGQAGFPAAVAPLGTAITEQQIAVLWRLADEPVLCLDGDQAGRRAGFRAAERALGLLKPGRSLRFAALPEGEDPDSLVRGQGPGRAAQGAGGRAAAVRAAVAAGDRWPPIRDPGAPGRADCRLGRPDSWDRGRGPAGSLPGRPEPPLRDPVRLRNLGPANRPGPRGPLAAPRGGPGGTPMGSPAIRPRRLRGGFRRAGGAPGPGPAAAAPGPGAAGGAGQPPGTDRRIGGRNDRIHTYSRKFSQILPFLGRSCGE